MNIALTIAGVPRARSLPGPATHRIPDGAANLSGSRNMAMPVPEFSFRLAWNGDDKPPKLC